MHATLLDGQRVAAYLKAKLAKKIAHIQQENLRIPKLAVILLGQLEASAIYVQNKQKACKEVGIASVCYALSHDVLESELLSLIEQLNLDDKTDGILVQLPLPSHIDASKIVEAIHPNKDVDGFHPYNLGRLAQRNPSLRCCTSYGVMQLLSHYEIAVAGKEALIIGASNIVGRPMALELLLAGATVTVAHSRTIDLEAHVKQAEIVVSATGVCDVISSDWLNSHHILVDVGILRLNNRLRGDINFIEASKKVAYVTPVPGGVGPMTVVSLLQNTLTAYYFHNPTISSSQKRLPPN